MRHSPKRRRASVAVGSLDWHWHAGIADRYPSYVIMQPTTLCNLDCAYCYLPFRARDQRMPVEVARGGGGDVNDWAGARHRFSVIWHGGEPLAAGREHLAALMAPFRGVEHHIQTNATLIDDAWCDFFVEHDIRVGVSIDGAAAAHRRSGWTGAAGPAYDKIMQRHRHAAPRAACRSPRCAWSPIPSPGSAAELYAVLPRARLPLARHQRRGAGGRQPAVQRTRRAAVRGVLGRADRGVAGRSRHRAARDRVGAVVRRRRPRRHRRRSAAAPASTRSRRSRTTATWCCSRPSWPASPTPRYGDVRQRQRAATRAGRRAAERSRGRPTGWIAEYLDGVEACRDGLPVLRLLRRRARGQPVLRARPLRRHRRPTTAATARSAAGRSARPCPTPADPLDRA